MCNYVDFELKDEAETVKTENVIFEYYWYDSISW